MVPGPVLNYPALLRSIASRDPAICSMLLCRHGGTAPETPPTAYYRMPADIQQVPKMRAMFQFVTMIAFGGLHQSPQFANGSIVPG
jgi:hypothetical protein